MLLLRLVASFLGIGLLALVVRAAELPPLPKAVTSFGAVATEGYIYVYGGHSGKTHIYDKASTIGTFHRLKISDPKAWEHLPSGPIAQGVNLAVYQGKILRVGGMSPRNDVDQPTDLLSLKSAAIFDPKGGRWEPLPDLPAGRSSHDLAVSGDTLYVVGGWNSQGKGAKQLWHDTYLTLDLSQPEAKWESRPQPFVRRALSVGVVGDKLYVVGGLTPDSTSERTVNVLNLATGQWSDGPKLPGKTDRVGFSPAVTVHHGRLIVSTLDGTVARLTADGKSWEIVGQAEKRRMVHRILPWGEDAIVMLGGTSAGAPVADLEVLKLAAKGQPVTDGR